MGREKKKYEAGAATQYISRKQACKKLQLSLADFRRLCILKGVYPRQPANKKKVNKGSTSNKTFYFLKDILFLSHEKIINKFREYKIFVRKLRKAEERGEKTKAELIRERRPTYQVDHIVRERYPQFIDAVRDLDDALCMCFLFARLPKSGRIHVQTIELCRRLTVEFMHYVIASRSLRKVFISIKGIYFQAEIKNQPVTWVVAHDFPHAHATDVDFRVMSTFTEFYHTMLGFVNWRLYHDVQLCYPPKLNMKKLIAEKQEGETEDEVNFCNKDEISAEVVKSLNAPLTKVDSMNEEDQKADEEQIILLEEGNVGSLEDERKKRMEERKFKSLFEGCKFFISREVAREAVVFIIRCFGGEVSWEKTVAIGSTYDVNDETITHQLVDRPNTSMKYMSRTYVQPQWVFDCVNARMKLDVKGYLPGDDLPPHLSPFAEEKPGSYIPPERQRIIALQRGEDPGIGDDDEELSEEEGSDGEDDEEIEEDSEAEEEKGTTEAAEANKEEPEVEIKRADKDCFKKAKPDMIAAEEKRLAVSMMSKKTKKLYGKIKYGERRRQREADNLATKRKNIDEETKQNKKKKKAQKS